MTVKFEESDTRREKLAKAFLSVHTVEECLALLYDLCTERELEDMGNRFEIANFLYEGHRFMDVENTIGVSSATISRVSRCLKNEAGGYQTVLKRLSVKDKVRKESPDHENF